MTSTPAALSPTAVHQSCLHYWDELAERLRSTAPWEWPERVTPWLTELAGLREGASASEDPDFVRLAAVLAMLDAIGRLHRSRTGAMDDAFRTVRADVFEAIQQFLSPQEVFGLLDAVDFESRSLERVFATEAA